MNLLEVMEGDSWRGSAVRGASAVVFGIWHRAGEARDWLIGLGGVLSIALAVVLVADPSSGVLTITWAVAWFAIIGGVVSLLRAWQLRHPQAGAPSATPRRGAVA
jgi:uncharacterized membrane protein HdeD (DUF308 family)